MRQRINEIEFKEEEVDELSGKKKKEEIKENKLLKNLNKKTIDYYQHVLTRWGSDWEWDTTDLEPLRTCGDRTES